MKANFKFPLTVNKRSVEFPNSTAMRISICNAPGNQNRGRTRRTILFHRPMKNAASNGLEAAQGIGFIENS